MKKPSFHLTSKNVPVVAAIALGSLLMVGLIISMSIFSNTKIVLARESITVKGVAYEDVTADYGIWTITLGVVEETKTDSLREMEAQQKIIEDYLSKFDSFKVEKSIPTTLDEHDYSRDGDSLVGYKSTITFKITTREVAQLYSEAVAFNTFAVEKDLDITTNITDFLYSKLDSLKIDLLEEAVEDAKDRAKALSSSSDTKIGKVKRASQGVFQVNERDSFDVSAGGNYNTESVDKTVQATVDITFELL